MRLFDLQLSAAIKQRQQNHPNPLGRFGCKAFSQADEDGITLEILRRLKPQNGIFAEFGVGNGLENNTLALVAAGWRGLWVGGQTLAYDPSGSPVLDFQQAWINAENVVALLQNGLRNLKTEAADLISVDYFGASLQSFADLFATFGYRCICCNPGTGANAFFVPEAQLHLFPEVPTDLRQIFSEPHYMRFHRYGHTTSLRTLETLLQTRFPPA